MMRSPEVLPETSRITKKDDFERAKREGVWMRGNNFDFIHLKSKRGFPRLGVIIPLHSHNVVERNRLKRRVKEVMRRFVLTELELGRDIVIRARKRAYEIDYETVKNELIELSRNMKEGENPK